MSEYKHGVYGETSYSSSVADATQVTTPVYIGTLPIHRLDKTKLPTIMHFINEEVGMFLITSIKDVRNLNFVSDDWEAYSLCEAIDAHFMKDRPIAPIILIANATTGATETKTATVNLVKSGTTYIGYLNDARAMIENMAITVASGTLEEGEFSYGYDGDTIKIVIKKENFNANTIEVSYSQIVPAKMDVSAFKNCLNIIDRIESVTNRIPNILCAPQYSNDPKYHDLMIQKTIDKYDFKWNGVVASDIGEVDSIESAVAWKKTNSYINKLEKVFYPKLGCKGKEYHMSTVWTVSVMGLDMDNDNIPYKSASNKAVFADAILCNKNGTAMYISESEANTLNENGITTAITTKGQIRLWGSHMGNYDFNYLSTIAVEDRFDTSVRMSAYIRNYLQYNYLDEVDESIDHKDIDNIINSVQMWLDSLVNEGMLLYAKVEYDDDSDIENGDIVFNIEVTYAGIAKSITFKVKHTDKGFSVFSTSEEGVEE